MAEPVIQRDNVLVFDAETAGGLGPHTGGVYSVTALGDGRLASASADNTVRVWDASVEGPGVCLRVLEGHTDLVTSVTALGDGRLASASSDRTVRVWDPDTGECLRVLEGHTEVVTSVTALANGRLASASLDTTVRVWDASSGVCLRVLEHPDVVLSVTALGPLGEEQRLASASHDNTVRVWDPNTGVCLRVLELELEGHAMAVWWGVTALGDGRLASASHDKTVRVWDASSGVCLRVLEGHTDLVTSVTALGDGRLASASEDKTVRVWTIPTAAEMEAAAAAAAAAWAARGAEVREGQTKCSICFEPFDSPQNGPGEEDTVTANCYHRFHRKCINKWLAVQRSCPVCRKTINVLHVLHSGGRNYKKRQTRRKKGKSRKTRGRRRYSRM